MPQFFTLINQDAVSNPFRFGILTSIRISAKSIHVIRIFNACLPEVAFTNW